MENIIRKKLVMNGTDTDFIAVKQYENNYTRIVVEGFEPEEGYNYICVYKKLDHFEGCHRESVVYEVPFVDNTIYVDNYITNELGTYLIAIVAIKKDEDEETIAIGSAFRIEVIKGVYTSNTQAPTLPAPLESKYQQLVNLIDEVTYKLETGGFDGFSPIVNIADEGRNHIVSITDRSGTKTFIIKDGYVSQEDYEAIAEVVENNLQPQLDALGQAIAEKMETYKTEVWNIGTADAFFEHIKADGTSERVDYNDLIEVYNNPRYFLYCEYPAVGLTLIPSLPPLDYDRILEFTCNWEYGGVPHQSRVIINENNQIKYDDRELALKNEIKVTDVEVNGESVVNNGIASLEMYSKTEIDAKIEQAKPADYEQLKAKVETHDDEIAFLKWAVSGEYTEVVDSTEAYSKSVPSNVYDKALLNKLGGKSVVVKSKNLFDGKNITWGENIGANGVEASSSANSHTDYIEVEPNTNYVVSFNSNISSNSITRYHTYNTNKDWIEQSGYLSITEKGRLFVSFTTPTNAKYCRFTFKGRSSSDSTLSTDIMLEKATTPTEYEEYFEAYIKSVSVDSIITKKENGEVISTKPISSNISKYFPNGMKSAGSVYDEVDLVRGVAIKRIEEVDLGSLKWSGGVSQNYIFYSTDIVGKTNGAPLLSAIFTDCGYISTTIMKDNEAQLRTNLIYIKNTSFDTAQMFKQAMNGVMLYYEVATPTETPLTQEDWEYLQALQVEANGTITFENAEMLSVPNEESYLKRV